jgi:starvation-inducible outer membrane lipoprotein
VSEITGDIAMSTLGYIVDREIHWVDVQLGSLKSWDVEEDTWYSGYKAALK